MNPSDNKAKGHCLLESQPSETVPLTRNIQNVLHGNGPKQKSPPRQGLVNAKQVVPRQENIHQTECKTKQLSGDDVVRDTASNKKRPRSFHDEEEPAAKRPNNIPERLGYYPDQVYILGKLLGGGAFGRVHKATIQGTKKSKVAIKLIPRNESFNADAFENECDILSKLDGQHKNVANCIDIICHPTHMAIVQQLGYKDVFDYFGLDKARASRPTPNFIRMCMRAILKGLAFAHDQGILHRDLKPENVLVMRRVPPHLLTEDDFQIADWGLGHMEQNYTGGAINTRSRVGTFPYLPIDLCGFNPPAFDGRKGDIWSAGMLLAAISGYMSSDWMDNIFIYFDTDPAKFRLEIGLAVLHIWMDGAGDLDVEEMLHFLLSVDIEDRPLAEEALTYGCFNKE